MDAARSVSATFGRLQRAVAVSKTGTGAGVVTSSPAGIDCGATCTAMFDVDRTVTPDHGKMVIKEPCFKISAADPDIAAARAVEKKNPQLASGKPYPLKGGK